MSDPTSRNRLDEEGSPYLRQHAANPVNWQPWDEQARTAASERDVPIFLSIGYSACHWCHVMEAESFADEAVAEVLNEGFVPVTVDREERPDVDPSTAEGTVAVAAGGSIAGREAAKGDEPRSVDLDGPVEGLAACAAGAAPSRWHGRADRSPHEEEPRRPDRGSSIVNV